MSIHVALRHVTHYRYDRLVNLSPHVVRLRPAPHCRTPILSYSLNIEPAGHFINWQQDPFSNYLARLVFPEKTGEFKITVDLVAEMSVFNPFDFFLEPSAEQFPFAYSPELSHELQPYLAKGELTPALKAFIDGLDLTPVGTVNFLVALNQKIHHAIRYLIRLEPGVQTPEETLTLASGSCRDSGWLLAQVLRHLGLATRFVSGYLIQLKPDVKSLDGPSGAEADFTDLHAWCEVYLPGAGWIGLDRPSPGLLCGRRGPYNLSACSPEPGSAAPVSGAVDKCEVAFEHQMEVSRWNPRASPCRIARRNGRPSTPWAARWTPTWWRIDVRLTMGGEPTFVADHDRDAEEWNTSAQGPTKRGYATELVQKLCARYGAGGFFALWPGQMVSGRAIAALGAVGVLAADLASRAGATRPCLPTNVPALALHPGRRQPLYRHADLMCWAWTPIASCPATKTSGITCGASASCR
ncbi:MAG: transglutaminase family protein [Rivihabitans pingtungensis]